MKQISNGVTIRDENTAQFHGAYYIFNGDNTLEEKTLDGNTFTMQYTLVGDSLTFIHTENKQNYGAKEYFRVKKLTKTEAQLSYSPKIMNHI